MLGRRWDLFFSGSLRPVNAEPGWLDMDGCGINDTQRFSTAIQFFSRSQFDAQSSFNHRAPHYYPRHTYQCLPHCHAQRTSVLSTPRRWTPFLPHIAACTYHAHAVLARTLPRLVHGHTPRTDCHHTAPMTRVTPTRGTAGRVRHLACIRHTIQTEPFASPCELYYLPLYQPLLVSDNCGAVCVQLRDTHPPTTPPPLSRFSIHLLFLPFLPSELCLTTLQDQVEDYEYTFHTRRRTWACLPNSAHAAPHCHFTPPPPPTPPPSFQPIMGLSISLVGFGPSYPRHPRTTREDTEEDISSLGPVCPQLQAPAFSTDPFLLPPSLSGLVAATHTTNTIQPPAMALTTFDTAYWHLTIVAPTACLPILFCHLFACLCAYLPTYAML